MGKSDIILAALFGIALTILLSLGFWQVRRLHWKEALIVKIETRLIQAPVTLSKIKQRFNANKDVDLFPVLVSGRFDHDKEVYYFTTFKTRSGWHVYVPLKLDDGQVLIVNRGFIPYEMRDLNNRPQNYIDDSPENLVAFKAIIRMPDEKQTGFMAPDNNLDKREFYWRSLADMSQIMRDKSQEQFLPFFAVLSHDQTIKWPHGGTTRVELPNNHLGYIITWFGLAATLLGVGVAFVYSRLYSHKTRKTT